MKRRSLSRPSAKQSPSPTIEQSGSDTMDQRKARRILAEASERARRRSSLDFRKLLFKQQRNLLDDESKTKVAVCSRRAGKSFALSVLALDTAFKYEGCLIPVIEDIRPQAELDDGPGLELGEYRLDVRAMPTTGFVGIGPDNHTFSGQGGPICLCCT